MNIMECDIDHVHYWIASLGLGSNLTRQILDKGKREGRCPMGIGDIVIEMIYECEQWCAANCTSDFQIDPNAQLQIFFTSPNDAMRFKLTYG